MAGDPGEWIVKVNKMTSSQLLTRGKKLLGLSILKETRAKSLPQVLVVRHLLK